MKYSVELSKEAVISIRKASDYYLEIHADLKDDFIKEHPFHFQIRSRGIRIVHLKRFLLEILFIVESQTVFVLQVLHQKMFYK